MCKIIQEICVNQYGLDIELITCDTDEFGHVDILVTTQSGNKYIINCLSDLERIQLGMKTTRFASEEYFDERYSSLLDKSTISFLSEEEKRKIKNDVMGMVYQNPVRGLRMDYSAASNIAEKIIAAGSRNAGMMTERARELLQAVEILTSRMGEAPKNFSGGMQQRVQISKALANNPSILLLDEVTTGLDLSVQAKVLDLIRKIKNQYGISILLVSHDLAVIRMLADRTIVMLDGKIIESGLTDQILEDPQHEYTQQLVHSLL